MKKELFINHVKRRGTKTILNRNLSFDNHTVNAFRELKHFIKYIDFGCKIKDTGGCRVTPSSLKCCCHDCTWSVGYFQLMLEKDLTYYARHFTDKTGFWRKGKGCVLPHNMRSTMCLTHHCNYQRKGYEGFGRGMSMIKNELRRLRGDIK